MRPNPRSISEANPHKAIAGTPQATAVQRPLSPPKLSCNQVVDHHTPPAKSKDAPSTHMEARRANVRCIPTWPSTWVAANHFTMTASSPNRENMAAMVSTVSPSSNCPYASGPKPRPTSHAKAYAEAAPRSLTTIIKPEEPRSLDFTAQR